MMFCSINEAFRFENSYSAQTRAKLTLIQCTAWVQNYVELKHFVYYFFQVEKKYTEDCDNS